MRVNKEFSLAQLWAVRGTGDDTQTVEVGWQEYKKRTGSEEPVLFVYSTSDNYDTDGCYDDDCGRWVQTDPQIVPGASWVVYSVYGGTQYSAEFKTYRSTASGHWYVALGGDNVGYYPTSLFDNAGLDDEADEIEFGGEIIDYDDDQHTTTDMGSGAFPSAGWQHSSYIRNMMTRTLGATYVDLQVDWSSEEAGCYEKDALTAANWGEYIYFGGEGYHAVDCP